MRKLKGPVKETPKQKRERKQEFAKMRQQIHTVVLPTVAVVFILICVYVYLKTRPSMHQQAV
ncbi:single-pass membrane and coiled-coil domain-containing protein 4 [Leptidea sinapis]|uniref:single-pass membrane and coiled-coil domain-containing protein 4 n=1 Tax=Leptidea sinapis TaxID=189913 RepID=UPI0021C3AC18|nr:single-pass membrane and coiled-coil domain-containing protein 4 [Leptidea sinapis]